MHSATTATGRPLPPPGKTLPNNRPAPLSCRATHQLAAQKPHVTSQLQYYIPALIDNERRSPLKINRQPTRLESSVSLTKQTPVPPINRQQLRVLHPALCAGEATSRITNRAPHSTNHVSLLDRNGRFRRNNNSRNSFKTNDRANSYSIQTATLAAKCNTAGSLSNRHFLQVSASQQRRIADAKHPPQIASNIVSN
jgi:hypothetical protein